MNSLQTLPASSVPAAFDRGRLYSPTLYLTRCALDDRYLYDYRPGDLFEPMPPAPRGNSEAWIWWWRNTAHIPVPDFLGLRVGDAVALHLVTCVLPGTVVATYRNEAVVRYPLPASGLGDRTHDETTVRCRNDAGQWY